MSRVQEKRLTELAGVVAREEGCGGKEVIWCWGEADRTNCQCRIKAAARLLGKNGGIKGRPAMPLKVFDVNQTIEVQDANGKPVIKWTGFEGSDFGLKVQREMATALVKAVNKVRKQKP